MSPGLLLAAIGMPAEDACQEDAAKDFMEPQPLRIFQIWLLNGALQSKTTYRHRRAPFLGDYLRQGKVVWVTIRGNPTPIHSRNSRLLPHNLKEARLCREFIHILKLVTKYCCDLTMRLALYDHAASFLNISKALSKQESLHSFF